MTSRFHNARLGRTGAALAAALLAFAPAAALAQAPKAAAPAAAPKLVLPEEKKDFGTVPKGEVIHATFVLKNEGKADLHVTDVKPSCGCTAPEYDKTIKAGAEGKIVLNVDTKTFQGPISKSALILTDDPEKPQVSIFVLANVRPYVETHPVGYFRLQALTGEVASSEIVIFSEEPDFKPTKAEAPNSYMKASLAPVPEAERVAGKPANQWKVTVSTTPDAPEGLLGGYVKVLTGAAKQPELSLAVSGYIKPTLSITPLSVNFGNFEPKADPVKRTVTIINNNTKNEAFQVTKAESSVPGVKTEVVMTDKARAQVVISIDDKVKKGVFDGVVTVSTNDPRRRRSRSRSRASSSRKPLETEPHPGRADVASPGPFPFPAVLRRAGPLGPDGDDLDPVERGRERPRVAGARDPVLRRLGPGELEPQRVRPLLPRRRGRDGAVDGGAAAEGHRRERRPVDRDGDGLGRGAGPLEGPGPEPHEPVRRAGRHERHLGLAGLRPREGVSAIGLLEARPAGPERSRGALRVEVEEARLGEGPRAGGGREGEDEEESDGLHGASPKGKARAARSSSSAVAPGQREDEGAE